MATTKTTQSVDTISTQTITFKVRGTSPLIQNAVPIKLMQQMDETRRGLTTKKKNKEIVDPDQIAKDATHISESGNYGVPCAAFKESMVRAGKQAGYVMTDLKGWFFITGENARDGQLCPMVDYSEPYTRQDWVKVGPSKVIDLRYRPCFENWGCLVKITFFPSKISPEQLANLLTVVGITNGVGEWRPERGGTFGTFEIVNNE